MHQKMMNEIKKRKHRQYIPIETQKDTTKMFQTSINIIQEYLSVVNVPINDHKTQLMVVQNAINDEYNINKKNHQLRNGNNNNQLDIDVINDAKNKLQDETMTKKSGSRCLV